MKKGKTMVIYNKKLRYPFNKNPHHLYKKLNFFLSLKKINNSVVSYIRVLLSLQDEKNN